MLWRGRREDGVDAALCAWLLHRVVDPGAEISLAVAAEESGAPGRSFPAPEPGDGCGFDALMREFNLSEPALFRLALIARGAATSERWLTPESAGVAAVGEGIGLAFVERERWLVAALAFGDALYAYCAMRERG